MNPQLQKYFDQHAELEKQKRDEHLISLGLIDPEKSTLQRKYTKLNTIGYSYDEARGEYYKDYETAAAIEVTDEEYAKILEIEKSKKTPQIGETNLEQNVATIKMWVKFWSILSIVCLALSIIIALI